MSRLSISLAVILCISIPGYAKAINLQLLADKSSIALEQFASIRDSKIPQNLLSSAICIAVAPGYTRMGFVFSGEYGTGLVSCRTHRNQWSAPAVFYFAGAGWGPQLGYADVDLVMIFTNPQAPQLLSRSKGFSASFTSLTGALGPYGRYGHVGCDWGLKSPIFAYASASGAYMGLSLQAIRVWPAHSFLNQAYGAAYVLSDVLTADQTPPDFAQNFLQTLTRYSPALSRHEVEQ